MPLCELCLEGKCSFGAGCSSTNVDIGIKKSEKDVKMLNDGVGVLMKENSSLTLEETTNSKIVIEKSNITASTSKSSNANNQLVGFAASSNNEDFEKNGSKSKVPISYRFQEENTAEHSIFGLKQKIFTENMNKSDIIKGYKLDSTNIFGGNNEPEPPIVHEIQPANNIQQAALVSKNVLQNMVVCKLHSINIVGGNDEPEPPINQETQPEINEEAKAFHSAKNISRENINEPTSKNIQEETTEEQAALVSKNVLQNMVVCKLHSINIVGGNDEPEPSIVHEIQPEINEEAKAFHPAKNISRENINESTTKNIQEETTAEQAALVWENVLQNMVNNFDSTNIFGINDELKTQNNPLPFICNIQKQSGFKKSVRTFEKIKVRRVLDIPKKNKNAKDQPIFGSIENISWNSGKNSNVQSAAEQFTPGLKTNWFGNYYENNKVPFTFGVQDPLTSSSTRNILKNSGAIPKIQLPFGNQNNIGKQLIDSTSSIFRKNKVKPDVRYIYRSQNKNIAAQPAASSTNNIFRNNNVLDKNLTSFKNMLQSGTVEQSNALIDKTNSNSIAKEMQDLLPIGVLCKAGADHYLSYGELQYCKYLIMNAIWSAGPIANARGYEFVDGSLVIKCASEANFDWIKTQVEHMPMMGKSKFVFTRSDDKYITYKNVIGWVYDSDLKISDILACFEAQNPGISTKLWKVLSHRKEKNKENEWGLKLSIQMDQDSVNMLTFKYKNQLNMFLGVVEFFIEPSEQK